MVDLAGVISIGEDGRQLLVTMWEQGAVFHATDCLTRSIVENITGTSGRHRDDKLSEITQPLASER